MVEGKRWLFQTLGGKEYDRFAFSPYTAEARKHYNFFLDVELEEEIMSQDRQTKEVTLDLSEYTGSGFKKALRSGEIEDKIQRQSAAEGWTIARRYGYWRNRTAELEEIEARVEARREAKAEARRVTRPSTRLARRSTEALRVIQAQVQAELARRGES